jgi:hypothetical protein
MKHTSLSLLLLLPVQSTFGRGTWVIVLDSLPEVALRTRVQPQHQTEERKCLRGQSQGLRLCLGAAGTPQCHTRPFKSAHLPAGARCNTGPTAQCTVHTAHCARDRFNEFEPSREIGLGKTMPKPWYRPAATGATGVFVDFVQVR